MSDEIRQKTINIFRTSMKGYIGITDIQDVITCISFLFWNSKFNAKTDMNKLTNNNEYDSFLQKSTKENQDFVWNVCNYIRGCMVESDLKSICEYLNQYSEEQIINIICDDYSLYSRYNISTPKTVNDLSRKILEVNNNGNKVLDICSYTGNFLVDYALNDIEKYYTGIEINHHSNIVAQAKLNALKVKNNLICKNIFDYKFEEKFDKVFCNFPFGIKLEQKDLDSINKKHNIFDFEFTNRYSSCWAFVNSAIESLSNDGKAVVVMNNGGLYKMPDKIYREILVKKGLLEAVISLPEKLFVNTSIPITLLVLSRNNKTVKFINAEGFVENNINRSNITNINVDSIMNEYLSEKNTDFTKIVDLEVLENNNYSLYVPNYMEVEKIEIKNPKKLQDVCIDIARGYQVSSNEINQYSDKTKGENEYKIVNITNVNDGSIDNELTTIYTNDNKYDKYLLRNKDLLVSSKGTLSKFAVVELSNNERLIPSGNFTVLRLNNNIIDPYYLKIFFESNKGTAIINSIKSGGVLPAINIGQFKEINIPVPSIEEQRKIVNRYLAKNDEINILKMKLKKLEDSLSDIANEEF